MPQAALIGAASSESQKVLGRFRDSLTEDLDFELPKVGMQRDGHGPL
jgi:hypothetical protein